MPHVTPFCVFAYGTLKPGERAYDQFCAPFARSQMPALCRGRLYGLPMGYPAMTLETGWVKGFRLEFDDAAVLEAIDAYEGYYPEAPEHSDYHRLSSELFTPQRQPLDIAWAYIMNRSKVLQWGGWPIASGNWRGRALT